MTNPTPPAPTTAPPTGTPPNPPPAPTPTPEPPTTDPTPADPPADPAEADLPEGAKKALAAARKEVREAAKARAAAEAKVKEFEDRDKSELDKATDRATAAEKRAAEAEAAAVRLQVITDTSLPAELHEFLPASGSAEELRAKADKLKAAVAAQKPGAPKPDPSQGSRGPAGLEEQIAAAQQAGKWREVMRLERQKLNATA